MRIQDELAKVATVVHRLQDDGWRRPNAAADAGTQEMEIVEAGSIGVHSGYCDETGYWITESDPPDVHPSHPLMVRGGVTEQDVAETAPDFTMHNPGG